MWHKISHRPIKQIIKIQKKTSSVGNEANKKLKTQQIIIDHIYNDTYVFIYLPFKDSENELTNEAE